MTRRIAILAFDDCQSLDVTGPLEVFAAVRAAQPRRAGQDVAYAPFVVGEHAGTLRAASGLGLVSEMGLAALGRGARVDTLIVAGGAGARRAAKDARIVRAVARAAGRARRVASVCTGAFVLAATGVLDGRRATTHWAFAEELARDYPAVHVEPDPIYVRAGRIWTSAGVTAGIDLSLAMIEEDLGRDVVAQVARGLVVFVRRAGGQSQFSAPLAAQSAERAPLRELQTFIVEHPEARLDVPALAQRAAMSVRHFSRVFRAETGLPPADFVERVRTEVARRLLETSERSIEEVAGAAGFGTPEALRRAFARRVGLAPREYRARFGASRSGSRA